MRPYQEDSYKTSFRSVVSAAAGDRAQLAETYFYPTSGGQPFDTGFLGFGEERSAVIEVGLEDGHVWHRLAGPVPEVGRAVTAELEWPRRYRHMQRHTAQHLLSGAFVQLDPAFETRSVSLMGPVCTLDLGGGPAESDLSRAETLVNEVCYRNLEIHSFEVDDAEVRRYPLRRPPKVSGRIRLVQMGDFELSACGGTHLRSTAEALPVKLLRLERVKGGLARVHFRAGWEALRDYEQKHDLVTALALGFNTQPAEVGTRVEALRNELQNTQRVLTDARRRLAQGLAESLLRDAENGLVVHTLDAADADLLGPLAGALVRRPGTVALLAAVTGGRAEVLFARADDAGADMREVLSATLTPLGGRGGGSAARAQGSGRAEGLAGALGAAAAHARDALGRE